MILIIDFTTEVLEFCIKSCIHLLLKLLHTSHISQGEDDINLKVLKSLLQWIRSSSAWKQLVLSIQLGRLWAGWDV